VCGLFDEPQRRVSDQPPDVINLDHSQCFGAAVVEITGHRKVAMADVEFEAGCVSRTDSLFEVFAPIGASDKPDRVEIGDTVQEVQLYPGL